MLRLECGAAPPAAQSGPSCTFTSGSQSGVGNETTPYFADGTGLSPGGPVALPARPARRRDHGRRPGQSTGGGDRTLQPQRAGQRGGPRLSMLGRRPAVLHRARSTSAPRPGAGFAAGGNLGQDDLRSGPQRPVPAHQAEINAGLVTCVIAVDNITATTATGAVPSQADFAGESHCSTSPARGRPKPPNRLVQPAARARRAHRPPCPMPGRRPLVGRRLVGRRLPERQADAAPYPIPASNVLVNGSPAASGASVQVDPAVYCFYGGSSATSCNPGNGWTRPERRHLPVAALDRLCPIPPGTPPAAATVSIFEPNVWGSAFPGNNTNHWSFAATDLTAAGTSAITKVGYWEVASDGGLFSFGTRQLLRLHGRQTPQQADRGHGRHPRRRRLLGGGLRRRALRLR